MVRYVVCAYFRRAGRQRPAVVGLVVVGSVLVQFAPLVAEGLVALGAVVAEKHR